MSQLQDQLGNAKKANCSRKARSKKGGKGTENMNKETIKEVKNLCRLLDKSYKIYKNDLYRGMREGAIMALEIMEFKNELPRVQK